VKTIVEARIFIIVTHIHISFICSKTQVCDVIVEYNN